MLIILGMLPPSSWNEYASALLQISSKLLTETKTHFCFKTSWCRAAKLPSLHFQLGGTRERRDDFRCDLPCSNLFSTRKKCQEMNSPMWLLFFHFWTPIEPVCGEPDRGGRAWPGSQPNAVDRRGAPSAPRLIGFLDCFSNKSVFLFCYFKKSYFLLTDNSIMQLFDIHILALVICILVKNSICNEVPNN